jgi:hypothetical protein
MTQDRIARKKLSVDKLDVKGMEVRSLSLFTNYTKQYTQVTAEILLSGEVHTARVEFSYIGKDSPLVESKPGYEFYIHRINSARTYPGFSKLPPKFRELWKALEKLLPAME